MTGAAGPQGLTGLVADVVAHAISIITGGWFKTGVGTKDSNLSGIQIDNTEIVAQISGVDNTRIGIDGAFYSINGTIANWTITQTALSKTVTVGGSYKMITTISAVIPAAGNGYTSGLTIVTQKFNTGTYAWDTKLIINSGSYNDGGAARYGFSIWDNVNSRFLMNIGYGGTDGLMKTVLSGLTITGTLLSSSFSTGPDFSETGAINYVKMTGNIVKCYDMPGTPNAAHVYYGTLSPYGVYSADLGYPTQWAFTVSNITRTVQINGYNVPKFLGVTNSPNAVDLRAGDFFIGTNGTLGVYTGSQWWYYNHN
jgi:hypothetical protein